MQNESLELSLLSIFSLLSFFTFFIIQKYSNKIMHGSLIDNDFEKPQAFHVAGIPRSGGLASIISFFIFLFLNKILFSSFYLDYLFLGFTLFIIGFFEDLRARISPKKRLIFMSVCLIFATKIFDIQIGNNH